MSGPPFFHWGAGTSWIVNTDLDSECTPDRQLCIRSNPVLQVVCCPSSMGGIFLSSDSVEVIKTARPQISFGGYMAQWMHVFGRQ